MFSVIEAVLLRPVPLNDPDRVVKVGPRGFLSLDVPRREREMRGAFSAGMVAFTLAAEQQSRRRTARDLPWSRSSMNSISTCSVFVQHWAVSSTLASMLLVRHRWRWSLTRSGGCISRLFIGH